MGKRVLMIAKQSIAAIFKPRGKASAAVVRVCGPGIPDDARVTGFGYVGQLGALSIVLESPVWTDLVLSGTNQAAVNGIPILQEGMHAEVSELPEPAATFPGCAIPGYDDQPPPQETPAAQETGGEPGNR